jgi:hypothetical protein
LSAFVVLGISPERQQRVQVKCDRAGAHYDAERYARRAVAKPIRRPFDDKGVAERFAALATASGWLGVRVVPLEGLL